MKYKEIKTSKCYTSAPAAYLIGKLSAEHADISTIVS